jgi:hypothetical protein
MVFRIDTYQDFKTLVVEPDFQEFMADRGNLRKAWHCAGSLFHLHDWVYEAHKASIDAKYTFVDDRGHTQQVSCAPHFANSLGQKHPDFQLMRGIANASKHFALRTPPPGRPNPPGMPSHAANTYVTGAAFQPGAFQGNAFQVGNVMLQANPDDIEFSCLAQSVFDMWNHLFVNEGW